MKLLIRVLNLILFRNLFPSAPYTILGDPPFFRAPIRTLSRYSRWLVEQRDASSFLEPLAKGLLARVLDRNKKASHGGPPTHSVYTVCSSPYVCGGWGAWGGQPSCSFTIALPCAGTRGCVFRIGYTRGGGPAAPDSMARRYHRDAFDCVSKVASHLFLVPTLSLLPNLKPYSLYTFVLTPVPQRVPQPFSCTSAKGSGKGLRVRLR
jgi:hypothetical protein